MVDPGSTEASPHLVRGLAAASMGITKAPRGWLWLWQPLGAAKVRKWEMMLEGWRYHQTNLLETHLGDGYNQKIVKQMGDLTSKKGFHEGSS